MTIRQHIATIASAATIMAMIKFRRRRKAWLVAPAIVIVAAIGSAIPVQAQVSTPSLHAISEPQAAAPGAAQNIEKQAPDSGSGQPGIVYDPTAYNRAVKSGDWVYTPEGLAYKTCVSYAPDNSTITSGEIILPSGARQQIQPCAHPTLAYPGVSQPAQANASVPASGPCTFSSGGPWWAATCWDSPRPVIFLADSYIVPTNPHKSGALIFLWGGLQDSSGNAIIQDVLTWGANKGVESNPKIWYDTPWYGYRGHYVHGKSIHVSPGDIIANNLSAYKCNSKGVCSWILTVDDLKNSRSATYTIVSHVSFTNLPGAVMEVPRVNGCTETPASGHAAFRNIQAEESNGDIPKPKFGISYPHKPKECGVSVKTSATEADIRWKP